jgi:hypothetical protein
MHFMSPLAEAFNDLPSVICNASSVGRILSREQNKVHSVYLDILVRLTIYLRASQLEELSFSGQVASPDRVESANPHT